MEVKSNVLDRQYLKYQEEYEKKALEVLRKGWYVLGPEVQNFEEEFASYMGAKYCVGLASGLDALWIALRILGIGKGDEVLVQGNTYIATVMGITMNDATPIFIEPDEYHNMDVTKIEEKITDKTKAILVTHLYGQATHMKEVVDICKKHNLYLVEDCAQSHGAKFNDQMTGTFGDVGCFSFYPSKNLGAFGDGGAIITNNEEIAQKFKVFRNYGSEKRYHNMIIGANSRLDELQAALLRIKLSHLDELQAERNHIAERYLNEINNEYIMLPKVNEGCTSVWHLFVIRSKYREELMEYLNENGIQTLIHYPIPPHLQKAYEYLNYQPGTKELEKTEQYAKEVVTLPLYYGMTEEETSYVIDTVNQFKVKRKTL